MQAQADRAWTLEQNWRMTAYTESSSDMNSVSMYIMKLKRAHATKAVLEEDVVGVSPITAAALLLAAAVNCTSREVPSVNVLQTRPLLLCSFRCSGILESFIAALCLKSSLQCNLTGFAHHQCKRVTAYILLRVVV